MHVLSTIFERIFRPNPRQNEEERLFSPFDSYPHRFIDVSFLESPLACCQFSRDEFVESSRASSSCIRIYSVFKDSSLCIRRSLNTE